MTDLMQAEETALTVAEVVKIYEDMRQTYVELPVPYKRLPAGRVFKQLLVRVFELVSHLENQAVDLEDSGYLAYTDTDAPRNPSALTVKQVEALSLRPTFNLRICVDVGGRSGYALYGPSRKDKNDLLAGDHDLSLKEVLERAERQIRSALSDLAPA